MRTLLIEQVGPVKKAELKLKRHNVIIGPQSSGKSTIAKLLSTCEWMEKEACTTLTPNVLPDGCSFRDFVGDYHRMHGYFRPGSKVEYDSEFVHISYLYDDDYLDVEIKDYATYKRKKISYVPSDRNVVTMKDIEKRNLENTNFRSFLFDWLDANRNYDKGHKIDLMDMGMSYYYDTNAKEYNDHIVHTNGTTYDIALYDASSGLQSVVPLLVLLDYLSGKYIRSFADNLSYEQKMKMERLFSALLENEQLDIFKNLSVPSSVSYIVEEPEQNLFPQTQTELIKSIITYCNKTKERSESFVTTHSPYVLAFYNILLFAGKLREMNVNDEQWRKFVRPDMAMSVDELGVYAIRNGECRSIIDKKMGLIDQNELDSASEYNSSIFNALYSLFVKNIRAKK